MHFLHVQLDPPVLLVRADRLEAPDEGRVPSAEPQDGPDGADDHGADRRGGGAVQEHAHAIEHGLPGGIYQDLFFRLLRL